MNHKRQTKQDLELRMRNRVAFEDVSSLSYALRARDARGWREFTSIAPDAVDDLGGLLFVFTWGPETIRSGIARVDRHIAERRARRP